MTAVERRLILAAGSFLVMCVAAVIVLGASVLMARLLPSKPPNCHDCSIMPMLDILTAYSLFPLLAIPVAAAPIAYLLWDKSAGSWKRAWLYGTTTIILGAFSLTNYIENDTLISFSWQFWINIALVFAALVAIFQLWTVSFSLVEAKILKYVALFFLAAFTVMLPMIFDLLFAAVKLHIIDAHVLSEPSDQRLSFFQQAIMTLCSVGGLVVSILNYKKEQAKTPAGTPKQRRAQR